MVYGKATSSGVSRFTVLAGRVSNWCARLLGTFLVVLVLVFVVGEGPLPFGDCRLAWARCSWRKSFPWWGLSPFGGGSSLAGLHRWRGLWRSTR